MYQQRKMASGGKAPKDESGAAADDKYRYLPNYYKVKGNEHFANSSSSTVKCKLPAPPSSLDSNSCSLKWCVALCQNYIWLYFRDAFNTFLDHILRVLLAKLGFLFVLALCAFVVATQYMDLEAAPEASLSIQDEELVARSLARVLTELKVLLYSKYFRRQEHCCPVCPCLVCFRGGDAIPAKLLRMCQVCPVCTEHCAGFSLSTKGNTINSILCFSDHR